MYIPVSSCEELSESYRDNEVYEPFPSGQQNSAFQCLDGTRTDRIQLGIPRLENYYHRKVQNPQEQTLKKLCNGVNLSTSYEGIEDTNRIAAGGEPGGGDCVARGTKMGALIASASTAEEALGCMADCDSIGSLSEYQ